MYIIHLYIIYKLHIYIYIYKFYFKDHNFKELIISGETQIVKHMIEANVAYL